MRPQLSGYFQLAQKESREIADSVVSDVLGAHKSKSGRVFS
jgi:hypothetical protein